MELEPEDIAVEYLAAEADEVVRRESQNRRNTLDAWHENAHEESKRGHKTPQAGKHHVDKKAPFARCTGFCLDFIGGQGRDRTGDTRIFSLAQSQ